MEAAISSPLPGKKAKQRKMYTFHEAVELMLEDRKLQRLEWADQDIYCTMAGEALRLFKKGDQYDWLISRGDIMGNDWVVVVDTN